MCSNQGPAPPDEGDVLTEAEFDALSKQNVERWVSAHIIPVSTYHLYASMTFRSHSSHCCFKISPIPLNESGTYPTLLEGKEVTIEVDDDDESGDLPDWARVVVNDDVWMTGMKEVSDPPSL